MKILRESLINEHDWKQPGDDARTARVQLMSIQEKVTDLLDYIKQDDNLDAWVQMKITQAEDGLNSVRNYIVFEEDDEGEDTPEIITDNPPVNIASEKPVSLEPEVAPEDELEMGDIAPDVIDKFDDVEKIPDDEHYGEEGPFGSYTDFEEEPKDYNGSMKATSNIPLDKEEDDEIEDDYEDAEEMLKDSDYVMESLK